MSLSRRWENMPEQMKKLFFTPSMWRVLTYFRDGAFGITSAFRPDATKEDNLKSQFELGLRIIDFGHNYMAQVGAWNGVRERCLFIPEIKKNTVQTLAQEFGQEAYIWGSNGRWHCHDSLDDRVLAEGNEIMMLAPDVEFARFCQLAQRTKELMKDLAAVGQAEDEKSLRTAKGATKELERLEERLRRMLVD
jgi:hypothetical protein